MVICSNLKCKYRNDKGKCNNKKIVLKFWNVSTMNMERKDFLECMSFEKDEEYKRLEEIVNKLIKE